MAGVLLEPSRAATIASKGAGEGTGVPGNLGFDHMGIVVQDALRAAEFLMDVFDAEFDWEVRREAHPTAGERGWDKLFDVHPDAFMPHVLMLRCGEQPLTQYIELFEWSSPDQAYARAAGHGPDAWPRFSDVGFAYLSFSVYDMAPVLEHIRTHVYPKYPGSRLCQDPPMAFPLRGDVCTSTFLRSGMGFWVEITSWERGRLAATVVRAQRPRLNEPPAALAPGLGRASSTDPESEWIGRPVHELPTPAFVVDVAALERNARRLRERCEQRGVSWRAVMKAHRAPALARWMCVEQRANGVVLLSLAECEALAACRRLECPGVHVYLANQVPRERLGRLALVARALDDQLRVAVDSVAYAEALSAEVCKWEIPHPIEALLEFDIGHHRAGCNVDDAAEFARAVRALPGLRVVGVTGYEGHTPVLPDEDKRRATLEAHTLLQRAADAVRAEGVDVRVISAGGSSNLHHVLEAGVVNELQAGGGLFGDRLYLEKAGLSALGFEPAALLLASVTSAHRDGRLIVDAGFKHAGIHPFSPLPRPRDYGSDVIEVTGVSAEHLRMRVLNASACTLAYGDKMLLHAGYLDSFGFLHSRIFGVLDDRVVAVWDTLKL
jgi:D-serine deaminase-like pyridoxal phosphate-dependent protein